MTLPIFGRGLGAVVMVAVVAGPVWAADSSAKAPASSSKSGAERSAVGKGPLPDPTLLDGATLQAEKRSEHGMIGDFELPGDENARSGKVGGPPGQPGQSGGGQQQQPQGPSISVPVPGLPGIGPKMPGAKESGGLPLPTSGGGLGIDPAAQQQAVGLGQSGGAIPPAGGDAAQGGNPSQGGGPAGAAGQPGAKAEGTQVGNLQGEAGANGGAGEAPSKPSAVSIGDSAMRIEPSSNPAASGPNQQAAGATQQHEKGTGSGGKGSGGAGSGNRVEKGRVIPSGL